MSGAAGSGTAESAAAGSGAAGDAAGQEGCGSADAFQRLWAPDRLSYVKGDKGDGCPFCRIPSMADGEGLVVHRGATAFVVLNLYPYNPGHLMVVPYRHVAGYDELTPGEVAEVGALTQQAVRALRAASGAHGFNVGLNLGTVAGAGIAAHLHQHVVPRWGGDTNFMPVVGQTRVLPQLLAQTREMLAEAWPAAALPGAAGEGAAGEGAAGETGGNGAEAEAGPS